ncbi:hypothetical protein [Streptomyces sp. NPDC002564]|uniref:hypothetical protein n=1 Tax=Streptomyces sp. NPDC002564 TaxID=3364649 RepID=UPI003673ED32
MTWCTSLDPAAVLEPGRPAGRSHVASQARDAVEDRAGVVHARRRPAAPGSRNPCTPTGARRPGVTDADTEAELIRYQQAVVPTGQNPGHDSAQDTAAGPRRRPAAVVENTAVTGR